MNEAAPHTPAPPRTLYLRIAPSELCFARYEQRHETYFDFSPYNVRPQTSLTVNLREACETEPILQSPISGVQVIVSGPVTPVPLADFQEEDCEALYNYCFTEERKRRVFYDIVAPVNTVLLFSLDEMTCRTLEDTFSNIHYLSARTPVLRHFASKGGPTATGKRLFVYCHEHVADITVFEENRLVMTNTYEIHEPADAAYYVFNITRHLAIDNATTPFFVAGTAELRDPVVTELRHYTPTVHPIHPSAEFNRNIVATTAGVPYDLMALLIGN